MAEDGYEHRRPNQGHIAAGKMFIREIEEFPILILTLRMFKYKVPDERYGEN